MPKSRSPAFLKTKYRLPNVPTEALVVKRFSFDAAHYLPGYKGPCANLHGHTWLVDVGFHGEIDMETGMVLDFRDLKKFVAPIVERFDHACINPYMGRPTAELLAHTFAEQIYKHVLFGDKLSFVRVWESATAYAQVSLPQSVS